MADPSTLLSPEPATWRAVLQARRPLDSAVAGFRRQLGLDAEKPVIMSGHQAAIWHCGILAKWLATAHAAKAFHAAPAWVVVDHDPEDFTTVRVPVRVAGEGGERIEAHPWRIASEEIATLLKNDRSPATIPPFPARAAPTPAELGATAFALPSSGPALERIATGLGAAAGTSSTVAEQITQAIVTWTSSLVPAPTIIFASRLGKTEFFGTLVARMLSDPARCVRAYNDATKRHPRAGIAPLAQAKTESGERFELPLWQIAPVSGSGGGVRRRVWSDTLASIPAEQLAPRALFLTALMRLAGCDLFIHGTGGGGSDGTSGYDAVTDEWIRSWLGLPLAPTATVSATLRLPLTDRPVPSEAEVARARWLAHHARHDPASLDPDGTELAAIRREALAGIAVTTDKRVRAEHFRRLQSALHSARTRAAARLAKLDAQATELAARAEAGAVLVDRTWAFPLHEQSSLLALSERIRAAISPAPERA